MTRAEALALLGLVEGFDALDLRKARRQALQDSHPDHGGSRQAIEAVERAVEVLRMVAQTRNAEVLRVRRGTDRPSFVVSAMPAETFELLLAAAAELGDVAEDDPPYRLEVQMHEPRDTWVVLEVVPDAGASTVSMSVESRTPFDLDSIRDVWVAVINASQRP